MAEADLQRIARYQREILDFSRVGDFSLHRLAGIALEIITLRQRYEGVLESDADEEQKDQAQRMLDYLEGVERVVVAMRRTQASRHLKFGLPPSLVTP